MAVTTDPLSADVPQVAEDYDGMMDALVDIQEKGDNMMAGIWYDRQKSAVKFNFPYDQFNLTFE